MWPLKVRAKRRFELLALGSDVFGLQRFEWEVAVEEVIIVVGRARALVAHGLDGVESVLVLVMVMAMAMSRAVRSPIESLVAAKVMVLIEGHLATVMISILVAEVVEAIAVVGATTITRTVTAVEQF